MLLQDLPRFQAIAAGGTHTCALTGTGEAYCWGSNRWGQLGNGRHDGLPRGFPKTGSQAYDTTGALREGPGLVFGSVRFRALSAGDRHTCGLSIDGKLYCWGFGGFGQLGTGELEDAAVPTLVSTVFRFTAISAGGTHTCAIPGDSLAMCWGGNWHGQLGDATTEARTVPRRVATDLTFRSIAAGGIHTCAVASTGEAYCWGDRRTGRLGTGRQEPHDALLPLPVQSARRFTRVSASFQTCAVGVDSLAYCWGLQGWSQEPAPPAAALRPVLAPLDGPVIDLDVGASHVCAITAQAALRCWGSNGHGQLGPAVSSATANPVPLPGLVRQASAGGNDFSAFSCAVLTTGSVHCWGSNRWLELGGRPGPSPVR